MEVKNRELYQFDKKVGVLPSVKRINNNKTLGKDVVVTTVGSDLVFGDDQFAACVSAGGAGTPAVALHFATLQPALRQKLTANAFKYALLISFIKETEEFFLVGARDKFTDKELTQEEFDSLYDSFDETIGYPQ